MGTMRVCETGRSSPLLAHFAQDGPEVVSGVVSIPLTGRPLDLHERAPGDCSSQVTVHQFLAGPENRLVEVAVRSVFEHPLATYNPLVLYGPSGTGKTHLARGLETAWRARYHRRRRVQYTTATDFARELADAIETQAMDDLRAKYRTAALLVFEDVGRLAGKPAAQVEFIHTFDALLVAGSRIVATACAAPAELPGIVPGLHSRLAGGLSVPLASPGPEARLAILRRLAALRGIDLSRAAADVLANGLNATVPELLGALVQLEVAARLHDGRSDVELVQSFLARRNGSRQPPLKQIAALAAKYFSVRLADLRGPSRRRLVVTARDVAMYLARRLTGESLKQIGEFFGGRDHSTVMHGCRKMEGLLKTDASVRQAMQWLQQKWKIC